MQIFVLGESRPDRAAIEAALRLGKFEVVEPEAAAALLPGDGRFLFAAWTLDTATRDLRHAAGRRVDLTSFEYDLLVALLRRPGRALSRAALTAALKGRAWDPFDRSIDTLVARLRKKIDTPGAPSLVRSVRGVGYVLCAPVAPDDT
ncbi:transcriptional regulator [Roseiarcus fermentans]|uniref:Transcriptional regulator n=1 Tax=Roseiarcus fermentans TaxID=1473586 RepID=A0A366FQ44_9HYPH|nr:winged helix-turn-helix domain-containing protein [Roseiarcus fermentans]RBP16160.1 transcriptional regulator [Roseiarcus fermentans]